VRFLMDANLPRSAAALLQQMGHDVVDVRDIGLRSAADDVVAGHARHNRQALVTRDIDFADIRNYPPADCAGIVVLRLPDDATAPQVMKLLEAFVGREDWLARLSGRLAIVEAWRVRFRPA
jgi:predicted nuclease of predicted toxin-antitoxin system